MRRPRPTQQCLWLGPDRHRGSCGHAITNPEPKSYANSNRYAFSVWPNGDADAYSNGDGYCYSDGNSHRDSDRHSHSYSNAQTHAHAQVCADTEASSHTAAQTVTVFAKANIVASGDK